MTNIAISKFSATVCVCVKIIPHISKLILFFRLPYLIIGVDSSTVRRNIFNNIYTLIQDFSEGGRVHKIRKKSCIQPGVFFQDMREVYSEIMQYFNKFDVRPAPRPTFDMDLKKGSAGKTIPI